MIEFFMNDILVYLDYSAFKDIEQPDKWEIVLNKVLLCKGPKIVDIREVLPDDEIKAMEEHCFQEHMSDL